jgi:hypothetical protein
MRRLHGKPKKGKSGTDNFYLLTVRPNRRPIYDIFTRRTKSFVRLKDFSGTSSD